MDRRFGWLASVVGVVLVSQGSVRASAIYNSIDSGQEIDGWRITFPQGLGVTLTAQDGANPTLNLEKKADFTTASGLLITFTQVNATAAATEFAITGETITNSSSDNFTSFDIALASPFGQGQSFVSTFDQNTFAKTHFSTDLITMTEGLITPGATVHFGPDDGGGVLLIDAKPQLTGFRGNFTLKEIPSSAPVPEPGATAMAAMLGLGGLIVGRRGRRARA